MSYLIHDHIAHLRRRGRAERTIVDRERLLRRLNDDLPYGLAFAATEQLDAWIGQPGWSPWTRWTYRGHVRGFYSWATAAHELDGDPSVEMIRVPLPRCFPHPVTDAELAAALRSPEPWFTAVVLAAFAGLRADEIARSQREHITADRIYIPRGKGGKPGSVPTHPFLWSVLADRAPGFLFLTKQGPVDGRWIPANARHHFDRIGLPTVHLHRFRHWYGTTIQALVGDARVTQECLRHEHLASTEIYTLVTSARRSQAVAALPVPGPPASL